MNIKEILEFIKLTLQNNVVGAVKALREFEYTVKLKSNKVEVTNPTVLPKVFPVKVTNPSKYEKHLEKVSSSVKKSGDDLARKLSVQLEKVAKLLEENKKITVANLKDISPLSKIEVTNPQKKVAITNMYELAKEIGKVKKAIEELELNPTITVPDVLVPPILIPEIKVPETKVVMDLKKLEELMSVLTNDPEKPLAVRLSDGKKFYEAIFEAVSGGSSRSYAYQDKNGERTYGMVDAKQNVRVSTDDRYGLNHSQKTGNTTYLGQEDADGIWLITRVVKSTGGLITMTYATNANNESVMSYTDAWTGRVGLTFGTYSEAF